MLIIKHNCFILFFFFLRSSSNYVTVFCVLCSPVRWLYVLSSWNVRENSAHCFSLLLTVFANYPWVATIIGHYLCIYLPFSNPTKFNLAHSLMGCLMGCLNSEIDVLLNAVENMRSIILAGYLECLI